MDVLITTIVAALLVGLVLAAGLIHYRLWRAGMHEERPLLMHRVLEREGVSLDGCMDEGAVTQIAGGMRRCLLCRDREICIAWLDGGTEGPLHRFCPNAELIARLRTDGPAAPA